MSDRRSRKASQHDFEVPGPERIRNVVLVGPSGSGKTSLLEALLLASGAITRAGSVTDGTTVSDFEEPEHAHQRSVSLAVTPLVHAGTDPRPRPWPGPRSPRSAPLPTAWARLPFLAASRRSARLRGETS